MIGNDLNSAFHALKRDRFHAILNIAGLTVALAVTFLFALFIKYEFSYENFFTDSDRVFRIDWAYQQTNGQQYTNRAPAVLAELSGDDLPDQTTITFLTFSLASDRAIEAGGTVVNEQAYIVDEKFFEVLDYPLAFGSYNDFAATPGRAALTESLAELVFGQRNVVGQNLQIHGATFQVAAILEDIPENSSLIGSGYPKVLISSAPSPRALQSESSRSGWRGAAGWVFVRLGESAEKEVIETQLESFWESYIPIGRGRDSIEWLSMTLRPLNRVHLNPNENRNLQAVYMLGGMAFILILVAGFNYINLSTAQALLRTKEVGIRKVLGARKPQLIRQFLGSTLLTTALAFVLALGLAALLLPLFSVLVNRSLTLTELVSPSYLLIVGILSILVAFFSGAYPAFFLASARASELFDNQKSSAGRHTWLRSILVGVQFSVALGLTIAALVTFFQTTYLRSLDLGFNKERILVINGLPTGEQSGLREVYNRRLLDSPFVEQVASSNLAPTASGAASRANTSLAFNQMLPLAIRGSVWMTRLDVDETFFDLYGIRPVAGRTFSASMGDTMISQPSNASSPSGDSEYSAMLARWRSAGRFVHSGGRIILSESAAAAFGFSSPTEAIGQVLRGRSVASLEGRLLSTEEYASMLGDANHLMTTSILEYEVIGVVPDVLLDLGVRNSDIFLNPQTRDPEGRTVYFYRSQEGRDELRVTSARLAPNGAADAVAHAEQIWREMFPDKQFSYEFIEDRIEAASADEQRMSQIFTSLTVLAIGITCLGLFGLVSFVATRRTREIAIRKVLGAKVSDVTHLLLWEFAKPILIASLVAWPVSWVFMRNWLDGFEYRIDLSPWFFISATALALAVAFLTVIGRTWKAAQTHPAQALKYE